MQRVVPVTTSAALGSLFVLTLLVVRAVGTIEGFEAADSNQDGVLDKAEFAGFAKHIQTELSTLMGTHLEARSPASAVRVSVGDGGVDKGSTSTTTSTDFPTIGGDIESSVGFWAAFVNSLIMIIVTELGDKTFFIAAVLAMRQVRKQPRFF